MRDDKPDVVDLRRYRERRARAEADLKRRKPRPKGREPLLGSRRNAGVILAVVALVLLALWLGPALL